MNELRFLGKTNCVPGQSFVRVRRRVSGHDAGLRAHDAHALVAEAICVIYTDFAVLELARSAAIACTRAATNGHGVRAVQSDVGAHTCRAVDVAGHAVARAGLVAANGVDAIAAFAFAGVATGRAVALLARTAAIHAGFVSVFHVVAA